MSLPLFTVIAFTAAQILVVISLVLLYLWAIEGRRWFEALADWLDRHGRHRKIYDRDGASLYLSRYYLIGSAESRFFSVMLHRFHRGDSDPHRHNHPWRWWISWVVGGGYWEDRPHGWRYRRVGDVTFSRGSALHRVELDERAGAVWTIFIAGPRASSWGFMTPFGLVDHEDYIADDDTRARARAQTERLSQTQRLDRPAVIFYDSSKGAIVDGAGRRYDPDTDSYERKV